jgi:hypothetical protein
VELNYTFFHSDDLDSLVQELRNRGIVLRPVFKKFEFTEIFAGSDGLILGKHENVVFTVSEEDIDFRTEYLEKMKVVLTKADDGFVEFRFGKYRIEEKEYIELKLETEFDERLFHDLIPAQQIQYTKARIFAEQLSLQAEVMSKEETRIIKEVSILSDRATECYDVSELEKILQEVSAIHMDFFRKFSQFKDVNEELFSAVIKMELLTDKIKGWYGEKIKELRDYHQSLIYFESKFEQTLNGVRDLFSLISLQLDMNRNRENIELQKRTSSLQAAAVVIEFVAVLYYSLKVWEYFVPIEVMPKWLSFLLLTSFTVSVVAYTEVLAGLVRKRYISTHFVIATLLVVTILILMYAVPSIIFSKA